jgi:hypothetical protein
MNFNCRNVLVYMLLGIGFFCALGAAQPAVEAIETISDVTVKDFETLLELSLDTQKTSYLKRVAISVVREMVKLGGIGCLGGVACQGVDNKVLLRDVFFTLIPLLSDRYIACSDGLLVKLQAIEKYIKGLTPEQKKACKTLFSEENYVDKLRAKIAQEQDGTFITINRVGRLWIDVVVLALMAVMIAAPEVISQLVKYRGVNWGCIDKSKILFSLLLCLTDAPQILSNAFKDNDARKRELLQRIRIALY